MTLNLVRDEGQITWYPEPHFSLVKKETDEFSKGTFRSAWCSRSADPGTFSQEMCSSCSRIPNLLSFKKLPLLRSKTSNLIGNRNIASICNA